MQFSGIDRDEVLVPEWAKILCEHRDTFANTLLRLEHLDGDVECFAFLHGIISPHREALLVQVLPEDQWGDLDAALELHTSSRQAWAQHFRVAQDAYYWTSMAKFAGEVVVEVLADICFYEGSKVGSNAEWRPFLDMFPPWQPLVQVVNRNQAAEAPAVRNVVFVENPWLLDILARDARGSARGSGDEVSGHHMVAVVDDELAEDKLGDIDVFDEVQRRRDAWAAEQDEEVLEHFSSTLRGGAWTHAHTGLAVDSVRAAAISRRAKDFCLAHGLQQSGTFSLRLYGEEVCSALASLWVTRMYFLHDAQLFLSDDLTARMTAETLEAFERPSWVGDFLATSSDAVRARAEGILNLLPAYLR